MSEIRTPQQKEAVYNRGGKLLVSAAAGSGKTKVLVDRLLGYLTNPDDPANLDEFLIITYTKAAASELRAKIAAKLSERIAMDPGNRHLQQQMQRLYLTKISTVHAFCADLLREYAYLLDIPADFRVADENECQEIRFQVIDQVMDQAYKTAADNVDFQMFVNSQGFGRDDRQIPEILLKVYDSAKCHLDPGKWLSWCVENVDTNNLSDASQTVWGKYLIEDLQNFLRIQIETLSRCVRAASNAQDMEKPVAVLQETISQLSFLECAEKWDEVITRKNIDFGRLTFSKKCTDLELVERIKAIRAACKKGLERKLRSFASNSEQTLADLNSSASAARGLIQLVQQFSLEFDSRKRLRRILDFADLEHKTLDLLIGKKRNGPTALASQIGARYREIMVDEYQDSNGVQDAIFDALTAKKQNCFMVGDVKQSIYQFRLADPSIFIRKYNQYSFAEDARHGEGRKVVLSSNFRSSNGVLQGANDVFSCCMSPEVGGINYDDTQMLREGVSHIPLNDPEVSLYGIDVQEDTYAEEATFVARKIHEMLDGSHMIRQGDKLRSVQPEDIVILLRSPGSVGGEFAYALDELGIRSTTGGSIDLLQTEEVITLRSLLQIISNPLQDIPLLSVLMSRVFGFSADDLASARGRSRRENVLDSIKKQNDEKFAGFLELLHELRQEARLYTVSQLIQIIFNKTSMDSIYGAMPDGVEKKRNLLSFSQFAADFEAGGRKDLTQFLEYLEVMEQKGLSYTSDQQTPGAVSIMSIHKSKGLEFPVVFLCGLSRSFNQESIRAQVLCHKSMGLGLNCVDIKNRVRYPTIAKKAIAVKMLSDSISEEMRVLYVAMTRPKDRLIMTYAANDLEGDLVDIALRLDMTSPLLMTSQVNCPGAWVLQAAMRRTEAGAFFAVGGRPDNVQLRLPAWHIQLDASTPVAKSDIKIESSCKHLSDEMIDSLRNSLHFSYPYSLATQAPSKQTATQMKGRLKDQEAAEKTDGMLHTKHTFRKPGFAEQMSNGKDIGNAIHAVMQHVRYHECTSLAGVESEIQRLVFEKRISQEQGAIADARKIVEFFTTPLGIKLRNCKEVLREFKFSILDDCYVNGERIDGEQVLLQGVVDCALIEPDGISVIDFKTDYVTESNLADIVNRYSAQINIYGNALERIYKTKIKAKYLYLFSLGCLVEVPDL